MLIIITNWYNIQQFVLYLQTKERNKIFSVQI